MLTIICPQSHRYKESIVKIAQRIGMIDYEILDPRSHDINRTFKYVLLLGTLKDPVNAVKTWQIDPPDSNLDEKAKRNIYNSFVEVHRFVLANNDPTETKKESIPRFKDLEEYLKDYKGQVIEIKMNDGSLVGIYPDGEKLPLKYRNEYHVSTIVNLAKLYEMFGAISINIKDL